MDASEKLVQDHLKHRSYVDVVYEPDGNIPPDFLVDGHIAIEVRRLNQNHFAGADAKGLEEVAIPLWNRTKTLLAGMGPPVKNESLFVHFKFRRPIEPWRSLEPKLRNRLTSFMTSSTQARQVIAAGQGFELEVFCRTSTPHSAMFVMAGCSDEQSGG